MTLDRIRLLRQLGTGPDGVRYEGVDTETGTTVTVHRLFLAAAQPPRWQGLLRRMRLLEDVQGPGVLPVLEWHHEGPDPMIVTPRPAQALLDAVIAQSVDRERALEIATVMAETLATIHRLGLAHGNLVPSAIPLDTGPLLDMCGLQTGMTEEELDIQAPAGQEFTLPGDVFQLASVMVCMLTGKAAKRPEVDQEPVTMVLDAGRRVDALVAEMLDPDPEARPAIAEVISRLARAESTEALQREAATLAEPRRGRDVPFAACGPGDRIGRYRLDALLGEGGMGQVFLATDLSNQQSVALKVLRSQWARNDEARRRFYREGRMLAEIDNPHIARFVEVNEDGGTHYLAMEFIDGDSVAELLEREKMLDELQALTIARDVARALADVHDHGIVHRDIKPPNILLAEGDGGSCTKLCDFGVARHMEPADEELTQAGMAVGTPHYMAPEQCVGGVVDARTDIYSLGITLFKMLLGVVPFNAPNARAIVYQHLRNTPPNVRDERPEISGATSDVVARMLCKAPDDRYQNARELLEQLERILRGQPTNADVHPRMPEGDDGVIDYVFEWDLESSPSELWPHVSNTERLNRAIGLNAIDFTRKLSDGRVETHGTLKISGMTLDWREHPYEWVAPRRMGVLREFSAGPFVWMRSTVDMKPQGSGTRLKHRVDVLPRGMMGRAAAAMEVGYRVRRNLARVYQRIDRFLTQQREGRVSSSELPPNFDAATGGGLADPFENAPVLEDWQRQRIETCQDSMLERGADPEVVARLCHFLQWAPPQEIGRIRPRAFARRFELDPNEVLSTCLLGAKEGLLLLLWDIICPRCRIPATIAESLRMLREHGHCDACNLDFELDFGSSVEIIFRAHPRVRDSELGTYCIGGPAHTPHVIAQLRLQAGERFEMSALLEEGNYRVVGRQLPMSWGFVVRHGATLKEWELSLRAGFPSTAAHVLAAGRQRLVLSNDFDCEVVARIERGTGRDEAVTAAEAVCNALFRELFPGQVLSPGQLISVSRVAILIAEMVDPWKDEPDQEVFGRLTELHRVVAEHGAREGGAVVKIHGNGVLVTFHDPVSLVRASLTLLDQTEVSLRLAAHCGPALATTINDRLDYFGRVIRDAGALLSSTSDGQLALAEAVYADPGVHALLGELGRTGDFVQVNGTVGQVLEASSEA